MSGRGDGGASGRGRRRASVPRWAQSLVLMVAPRGRAEDAIGDLNEMHGRRVARHGPLLARVLTSLAVLDMAAALLMQRLRGAAPEGSVRQSTLPVGLLDRIALRFEGWAREVGLATRALRRAPGFAFVTVATLGLAIGANTTIFSVVDTVLLDPLEYPESDRLVAIWASAPGSDLPEEFGPAPEFYVQYREQSELLEGVGMFRTGQTTARWADEIERLFIAQATPDLFTALGMPPAIGRLPSLEDTPGAVALISHRLWSTWFGADSAAIGRSFEVSGRTPTIVGVMPPGFRFPEDRTDVWVHGVFRVDSENEVRTGNFSGRFLLGRMKPDTKIAALEEELAVLASRLPDRFGGSAQYREIIARHRPVVRTLEAQLVGDVSRPLWLLMGTVGIVLLIACANVANLFSVRAESRRDDIEVRKALGAGRARLVRTQMIEALHLALLGGVVGVVLAQLALPLLLRAAPESIPGLSTVSLDNSALLFTVLLAVLTACAFGLVPSLRAARTKLVGVQRQRGSIGRSGRRWGRDALVLIQTSAALVLLVGAGLLLRSFQTLTSVDLGYETEDIFSFQVAPDREGVDDGPSFAEFHGGFMERVAALPGVESVGFTLWLPLDEGAATNTFYTEQSIQSDLEMPQLRMTIVGGEFFRTMGIDLRRGRLLEDPDHRLGANNIVVSEAAAARLWPGEDPIGQRLLHDEDSSDWLTVVGVVEDILVEDFRQESPDPMVYLPSVGPTVDSWAAGSPAYVVRSARADELAPEVRALMRQHVPESPMYRVFTMERLADRSLARLSFTMLMLGIASGLALVLGAVGLYGVLSYVVSTRNREIAVRMALGAERGAVRRMVVLEGARITGAGVITGVVVALFVTRLLDSLLFGVEPVDAATFLAMSAVMVGVAVLASYLPARRASAVDPMDSLRAD